MNKDKEELRLLKEDIWAVHEYLDSLKMPREGKDGTYSIVGRIKQLEEQFIWQLSNLESHYLERIELVESNVFRKYNMSKPS